MSSCERFLHYFVRLLITSIAYTVKIKKGLWFIRLFRCYEATRNGVAVHMQLT